MRLTPSPQVVGQSGIDPKKLTDVLAQFAAQINGVTEGSISAITNAALAAPTTGTWARGDTIRNRAPTGATPTLGWICTVGGTPGTWVAITVGGGGGGGGITALTGDVTASGTGSVAATLAASGVTAAQYVQVRATFDVKGRATAAEAGWSHGSSFPGSPFEGRRFVLDTNGVEYIYYNDGSGLQWVEF